MYAALISIAGSYATCELGGAAAIGVIAALIQHAVRDLQLQLMVSRRTGAINQHLAGGLWGLLAPGFFASKSNYATLMGSSFSAAELGGIPNAGYRYSTYDEETEIVTLSLTSRAEYCAGIFMEEAVPNLVQMWSLL